MPQKTATEWERAADEVDRAEWRLLDALDAGVDAAIAAAEDELARCQRQTGRLRPKRAARPVEQPRLCKAYGETKGSEPSDARA